MSILHVILLTVEYSRPSVKLNMDARQLLRLGSRRSIVSMAIWHILNLINMILALPASASLGEYTHVTSRLSLIYVHMQYARKRVLLVDTRKLLT